MRFPSLSLAAAIVLLGASVGATAANTSTLSPGQEQQVQQIVHDYLLNNPQILIEVQQKLQEQQMQQMQQIQKEAAKVIPGITSELFQSSSSPVAGNTAGDVTVVEFFDYQCPHCKDMSALIDDLMKQDPKLRVVYKEFPIFGNSSEYASKAALAAMKQGKYVAFHDALMQTNESLNKDKVLQIARSAGLNVEQLQQDMNSAAIAQELKTNKNLAKKLQLVGTPAFVIANTKNSSQSILIPGATNEEVLQGLIAQARNNKLS